MAKKKKSMSRALLESGNIDVDNSGPYKSPYISSCVSIYFGAKETPYKLHKEILRHYPAIADAKSPMTLEICLKDVTEEVGHTFVHHMYTGEYECLEPSGRTPEEQEIAEYKLSIQVYVAARTYLLPDLVEQAKAEIEASGAKLDLHAVIDTVEHIYPFPKQEDVWFVDYLKKQSMRLLSDREPIKADTSDIKGGELSIAGILLQAMADFSEKTAPQAGLSSAVGRQAKSSNDRVEKCDPLQGESQAGQDMQSSPATKSDASAPTSFVDCRLSDRDAMDDMGFPLRAKDEDCLFLPQHMASDDWKSCDLCRNRVRRQMEELAKEGS